MSEADLRSTISAVWRAESARIVASVSRMVRDVGLAEELTQDALLLAAERWPVDGVPQNPGAWLMTTARRRALDVLRHRALVARKHEVLPAEEPGVELEERLDADLGDDLLRLVFVACHPVLAPEARVALTLRLLGGLTTDEIARAFLAPEPTIAQRIVRAKRTLAEKRVPFEVPTGPERQARLASVLDVIYLVFNEGYAATAGDDWMRPALCDEALRLAWVLAGLMPNEPEAHALVALLELHASRASARTRPGGEPVLLLDQDRARWDADAIGRGLAALARAGALAEGPGPFALQAEIAACHARARAPEATDWERIATLYGHLAETAPSPVVELNRAVAVGMAYGPMAGLLLLDALAEDAALEGYHLLPSVRADLLHRLGRGAEAARELERAAALSRNERERALLLARAARWREG